MARDDPQFRIRLPAEMKNQIEEAAMQSGRSLNAEIVYRLGLTLTGDVRNRFTHNVLIHFDEELDPHTKRLSEAREAIEVALALLEELPARDTQSSEK